MKKTNKKFWLAALLTAAVLTGVSGCGEITTPSSSLTERSTETTAEQTQAETTAAPEETAETTDTKTTAAETLPAQESSETTAAETTAVSQSAGDTSAYEETAERLFGALDYIDQIGAGNLPKDESDTIRSTGSGAVYEKVAKTQFSSTADLKAYMESSLTQKMIDSRCTLTQTAVCTAGSLPPAADSPGLPEKQRSRISQIAHSLHPCSMTTLAHLQR